MKKQIREIINEPIYLLFLFLPSIPKLLPLVILICVAFSLKTNGIKSIINNIYNNKILLTISSFYFLYIVSVLLSENYSKGFQNLETKLSFLALPFAFANKFRDNKFNLNKAFSLMLFATIAVYFLLEIRAIYIYFDELHDRNNGVFRPYYYYQDIFFTNYFCPYLHHTYFGMYISLLLSVFIFEPDDILQKITGNFNKHILILLLAALQFQLLSKAALIITIILLVIYTIKLFIKSNKKLLMFGLFLCASSIFYYFFSEKVNNNIGYVRNVISNNFQVKDKSTTESTEVRTLIWETSKEIIYTNWIWGVGVGDTEEVLVKSYHEKEMKGAEEKKLNCHNQYLQTWLATGIAGIITLLFLISILIFYSLKIKTTYLIFTHITIAFNMLFESILEVQAGTIFFSLLICITAYLIEIKKRPVEAHCMEEDLH